MSSRLAKIAMDLIVERMARRQPDRLPHVIFNSEKSLTAIEAQPHSVIRWSDGESNIGCQNDIHSDRLHGNWGCDSWVCCAISGIAVAPSSTWLSLHFCLLAARGVGNLRPVGLMAPSSFRGGAAHVSGPNLSGHLHVQVHGKGGISSAGRCLTEGKGNRRCRFGPCAVRGLAGRSGPRTNHPNMGRDPNYRPPHRVPVQSKQLLDGHCRFLRQGFGLGHRAGRCCSQ